MQVAPDVTETEFDQAVLLVEDSEPVRRCVRFGAVSDRRSAKCWPDLPKPPVSARFPSPRGHGFPTLKSMPLPAARSDRRARGANPANSETMQVAHEGLQFS
jgi:hypothetical protein